tara:strand:- start:819 stop:1883 length:1065 start_codon:yes stop_codon:yes gene_type:complete
MVKRATTILEKISNIINKYKTPELQRLLDENHIKDMMDDQISEYTKYETFSMLQSFTVAYIEEEKTGYLLDGQHRLVTFSNLEGMGYDISNVDVPLVIYNVSDYSEVEEYFNKINKNSPIKPIGNIVEFDRDLAQLLLNTFTRIYIHEDRENTRCPNIAYKCLLDNIKIRNIKDKIAPFNKSIKDVFNVIIEINNYMHTISDNQINQVDNNKFNRCKEKAVNRKCPTCYLSIFSNFEWLDLTIYALINDKKIKDICNDFLRDIDKNKKRVKITNELKIQIWKKVTANQCDKGICYTCNEELYFNKMECGHIVAHALGGKATYDNMMPVCKTCNLKMGTMNLDEYRRLKNISQLL